MSERHLVKLCLFLFSCPCYLFIFECSILLDFFFVLSIDCITRSAEERERRESERERERERERKKERERERERERKRESDTLAWLLGLFMQNGGKSHDSRILPASSSCVMLRGGRIGRRRIHRFRRKEKRIIFRTKWILRRFVCHL
jgi:hypothetical protein